MVKKIGVSILCGALAYGAFGQEDSTRTIELANVTIQENRFEIPFAESSRNISILASGDIDRMPARSIPGLLSYVPGVDIRQRGPFGAQADIGIRGGSFEQTLILINGIKMSDPQTGHHALSLPLEPETIERVEILKGPAARIFGQNAFSGAVNFITRIPETESIYLSAYGGDFGLYGISGALSLPDAGYRQYISVARDASDGYRYNTDFLNHRIFYQAETEMGGGELNVLGGFVDRRFGANGFYANPSYSEQYEEVRTFFISAGYGSKIGKMTLKPRVYWRNNRDNYLFFREDPAAYRNDHITNVVGAEVNASVENSLGETGFGIEGRTEMISGDWDRGGVRTKSNLHGFHREKLGFYVEHKFKLADNKLHITPGVFINSYSDFGLNAFPGVDLGYSVTRQLRVYGNIGRSYRVPTFYDQYYKSAVEQGNPDLQPETALAYEGGLRYLNNGVALEANYFNQDASQLIDWVLNPADTVWYAQNFTDVQTDGIEVSGDLNLARLIGERFLIQRLFSSYNFIHSNLKNPEGAASRYTLDNLKNQWISGADFRFIESLGASVRCRFVERVERSGYWLLDGKVYWEGKNYSIFAEGSNLTDVAYTEVMTPMPGRWLRVGASCKLNL